MDTLGLQKQNLERLSSTGAFMFTDTFFPYTSGKIGPYFVQSASVTSDSDAYYHAIKGMAGLIEFKNLGFDVIGGGETRDWVFSYPLSYELEVPHYSLYKNGKNFGADLKGKKVLWVADLNNEGSSMRDSWVPMVQEAGGIITDVLFYVDRREAGVQVVKDLGLRSHAVVNLDEGAWEDLQEIKDSGVTPKIYDSLCERQEDPEKWAINMLRSDAGANAFFRFYVDEKSREKAKNILDVGYPDMKDEVMVGLENKLRKAGMTL
jgi:orotate phosphoribosyltransferase